DATKKQIATALRTLQENAAEQDQILIYYAGHGYASAKTGVGYWLPVDATTDSGANWISTADVGRLLSRIPAKNIMMIADSCYSGSFTKEQKISSAKSLNPFEIRQKRAVMAFSSGGDEPVLDGEVNSPFTRILVKHLNSIKSGAAVMGEALYQKVKTDVSAETPQTPQYGVVVSAGYDIGGDFVLEGESRTVKQR
ncbi:MAG: caspase family protein, partial [Rhodospirillaceae bacterium]